jgi:energy-coupling factor transporter ATP-binding protein EcfA2
MRVEEIKLKEVGPFEDAVLQIPAPAAGQRGELVLFEGPNGSGKTTIAQVIACACAMAPKLHQPPEEPTLGAPEMLLQARVRDQAGKGSALLEHRSSRLTVSSPLPRRKWNPEPGGDSEPARLLLDCARFLWHSEDGLLSWAAFAYRGHQQTPVVSTKGPAEIVEHPLLGALSFGGQHPASNHFGQLLVNLDYELAKATLAAVEARRTGASAAIVLAAEQGAEASRKALAACQRALSSVLGRSVQFEFPPREYTPRVLFDGEPIPLDLVGEGMRSTLSWLTDLLVRLYRIPWKDATTSPNEQPFWLILDEVDESLHPTQQMRLLPALRGMFPSANIYMTTHSPFVVASAGEGVVFPIRPDKDRRVRGSIEAKPLHPGQSLEWVTEEIFQASTGFIDAGSRDALRVHEADIARLRRKEAFSDEDWRAFEDRRSRLFAMGEEIRAMVAMQEVPVRAGIEAAIRRRSHEGSDTA